MSGKGLPFTPEGMVCQLFPGCFLIGAKRLSDYLRFGFNIFPIMIDWPEIRQREGHRIGLQRKGTYKQILNRMIRYLRRRFWRGEEYQSEKVPWHGFEYSAETTLPPLGTLWFEKAAR